MICLDPSRDRRRTGAGRRGLLAGIDQRPTMNIIAEEICGIRWRLLSVISWPPAGGALGKKWARRCRTASRSTVGTISIHPPADARAQGRRHHGGRQIKPRPDRRRRRSRDVAFAPAPARHRAANGSPPRPPTAVLQRTGLREKSLRGRIVSAPSWRR